MAPSWNQWGNWSQNSQPKGNWEGSNGQYGGHGHGQGQWWKCPCKECVTRAGTPTWNHSSLKMCKLCGEPRDSAKIEEEAHRARVRENIAKRKAKDAAAGKDASSADSDNAAPRRKRRSKKARNANKNKEEKAPEVLTVDSDMEDEEGEESEATPLSPALAAAELAKQKRRALLGLPLPAAGEPTKLYPLASATVAASAEEDAAKALAGQASEAVAALQKKVADLTSLKGMCGRTCGEKTPAWLDLSQQLDEETLALKKLLKNNPAACSKATEERLRTVRKDTAQLHTDRIERARTGREKAQARFVVDQQDIDAAVADLLKRKAENAKAFVASQCSFATYDEARRLQDEAALAILDSKIQLATPLGGAPAVAVGPAPTVLVPAEDYADLDLKTDVQMWSVPVLTKEVLEANPGAKGQIEKAWAFFANSPAGTILPPMTYKQLGFSNMETIPLVIGDTAMSAFYGGRTVYAKGYVPWQAVELIRYSLTQSNKCLARDATSKAEAMERLQAAREAAQQHSFQRPPY